MRNGLVGRLCEHERQKLNAKWGKRGLTVDTIVIAVGMPFCLAFLDQPIDEVVSLWESWVESGELVRARHEDPTRDAVIRLRRSSPGTWCTTSSCDSSR